MPTLREMWWHLLEVLNDGWRVIHGALTLILFGLALVLVLPPATFASSPTYRVMAAIGSENEWAVGFVACGFLGLAGTFSRNARMIILSAALLCGVHALIAYCAVIANRGTTGTVMYGMCALLAFGRLVRGGDPE